MTDLTYTLLTDGTSDRVLLPILDWLLIEQGFTGNLKSQWADLSRVPEQPKSLSARIPITLELYPCDLLCIHRDAENLSRSHRLTEIETAQKALDKTNLPVILAIIPIRMTEAWLLFDEKAIRQAAGNPNGKQNLNLPPLQQVESLPDPKTKLCTCLEQACGLTGRRLQKFKAKERQQIQNLASYIQDFSPLRELSAFQALEMDLNRVLTAQGWC